MILFRSVLFNLAFYAVTAIFLVTTWPVLLMPRPFTMPVMQAWGRASLFVLRTVAGTRVEIRGLQHKPHGGTIVAVKHQSAFETFLVLPLLDNPAIVMKRQIAWLPIFGLFTIRGRMIHVDRVARQRPCAWLPSAPARKLPPDGTLSSFRRAPAGRPAPMPSTRAASAGCIGGCRCRWFPWRSIQAFTGRAAVFSITRGRSWLSSCRPFLPDWSHGPFSTGS
jgi:hypothetical protein